jgi:predicted 3-demethylubiquinone-9 3-methyltransferase (glyoxalase superfamily)
MARACATFLMFDGGAEDAMNLYASTFSGSEIQRIERYGPDEQGVEGSIKRADFTLGGQNWICIDTPVKHDFTFTPSISIVSGCRGNSTWSDDGVVWSGVYQRGLVYMVNRSK